MKHLLFFICVTLSVSSFAQSTKWIKNRVSPTLIENCENIKVNGKKVKHGECFVLDMSNNELARGKYKNGIKDSVWNYYNTAGDLIQVYDYTNAKLIYNVADRKTIVQEAYVVDTTGYVNAKINTPKKLGGVNYGFYLLYNERNLPSAVKQQTDKMLMEYVFSLSETGKVESVSINYASRFYNTENPQSIDSSVPDAYEFLPATINGKPVKSKFIYQIVMEVSQARDRNLYAIPTQGKQ
jgi:DNA uptake protein ComE-like DNA-binding protein